MIDSLRGSCVIADEPSMQTLLQYIEGLIHWQSGQGIVMSPCTGEWVLCCPALLECCLCVHSCSRVYCDSRP